MILPMIKDRILIPALVDLPPEMHTEAARTMLLAIGLQESQFKHRQQIGGPARGFWQFEKGGGVAGVMNHQASQRHVERLCRLHGVPFNAEALYKEIGLNDWLAASMARLLLYTDPKPLPKNAADGWACYMRVWRPGKPHPGTWANNYALACA